MTAIDDLLNQLDEVQEIVPSTNWIQEAPGDLVAGRIVDVGSNTTDYGTYTILVIEPQVAQIGGAEMVLDEGVTRVAIHMMGTVRQNFVLETNPQIGGDIAVRYDGKKESATAGRGAYDLFTCRYHAPSALGDLQATAPVSGGVLG